MKNILYKIYKTFRGSCPRCGGYFDSDDDVCQTCGYPWND